MTTYTCGQCGASFESCWTDEEAEAEARDNGFDLDSDEMVVVCDDCYSAMRSLIPFPTDLHERRQ